MYPTETATCWMPVCATWGEKSLEDVWILLRYQKRDDFVTLTIDSMNGIIRLFMNCFEAFR